jgi:acyl-CoA thioesterase FadM
MLWRLDIGIADIDSYSMLYYGHYLRYNERAATACCQPGTYCQLARVEVAKYMRAVGWNDIVDIKTELVPCEDGSLVRDDECTLMHEWVREDGETLHMCMATYRMVGGGSLAMPLLDKGCLDAKQEKRLRMRMMAQRKESRDLFEPVANSYRRDEFAVFPDMISRTQTLSIPTIMDM